MSWRKNRVTLVRCVWLVLMFLAGTGPFLFANEGTQVQFEAYDGFLLKGDYYSSGVPGPGILLLHQCDREENAPTGYEQIASLFAQHGFNVLILDFRGYGRSTNEEFTRAAWQKSHAYQRDDVEAAYQFLVSRPEVISTKIGVVGASCGGRRGIFLATQHPEVKAVVLLSTMIGQNAWNDFEKVVALPTLFLTSEEDPNGRTTNSMMDAFTASQNSDSKLVIYKGEAHGTPLFRQDPYLEPEIVDWFERHLHN